MLLFELFRVEDLLAFTETFALTLLSPTCDDDELASPSVEVADESALARAAPDIARPRTRADAEISSLLVI